MQSVDEITAEIVKREGGYVNDPDDPGGPTKYGVTIHTLRRIRGRATAADVQALTVAEAVEIYKRHYFYGPKIDRLPEPLQSSVYDMQVNAGSNAVRILQRLLAEFGETVSVDGALGPQSIGATQRAYDKAGQYLVNAYGIGRRDYYFRLADRRPASRKYARTRAGGKGGWIKRAEEFMAPKYRLTETQFKQRVTAWA
ncbi:holin-associated N-acetylmuramidase [Leisingera sp. NJS204]|uniref:holin-associated N-acetylmuramidase n=1 Tax=Leisingera sp. NJS204 TaxID=2508307 RepID=UPI001010F58D|nr:holin-associated N-acetylmuramidase [Leisingera sp. NJS204]QAX31320.1 peptidoglycan-binding protein [Leisingera sp. NJS204]